MNEDASTQTATAADLIREWKYLTGTDFQQMDRAKTVVLVTCSPLEVHGPHLPVITDNLEAQKIAERAVELLHPQFPDRQFVHMPQLFVASDVLPHPGSVNFRSSTIVNVLEDLGRSLAAQGFVDIWVTSFHGGPRHFVPIEVAAHNVNKRYGTRMVSVFSLMLSRLTGGSSDLANFFAGVPGIRKEDLLGDHHGGAVETSLMLHLLGDRVQEYGSLPRNVVPDVEHNGEKPTLFEILTASSTSSNTTNSPRTAARPPWPPPKRAPRCWSASQGPPRKPWARSCAASSPNRSGTRPSGRSAGSS